ncbi:SWR1 complex subunit 6-like [Coffea arabica]|uniref:SWR1 complex subunit 6-like n=1 Tax=Coffea arabica TaxID=13443 RepID=A0A6P6SBK0_COFAR|nr:SWR1 complex subunit 6-like [Coffea arabica]
MEDDVSNSVRRMSTRSCKVAPKMAAAHPSSDNRTLAILDWLDALENGNGATEAAQKIVDDDDEASLDDDDDDQVFYQKKQSKNTKRKTRQAEALENANRALRIFLKLLDKVSRTKQCNTVLPF